MRLYHGTDIFNAEKIIKEGISVSAGRPFMDFGRGFYKAIVPALSIDKASSWPFNEAGDMRSRLL